MVTARKSKPSTDRRLGCYRKRKRRLSLKQKNSGDDDHKVYKKRRKSLTEKNVTKREVRSKKKIANCGH